MRRLLPLLFLATPLFARSLHWSAFDVRAQLDREGNLHVVERQSMVFDGDWNGGERDFGLRPRQTLDVNSIKRVDGTNEIPLTQGDLSTVDHWDYVKNGVVRWRSRLASDPAFENREITYVLDVTYHNVLKAARGEHRYVLDHDFGMPTRDGVIERFTLNLSFDPIWSVELPIAVERTDLPPGAGVVVKHELRFSGAGEPAGIVRPPSPLIPLAAVLLFLAGTAFLIVRFRSDEQTVGRFTPIVAKFDDAILQMRAEVAGAAWDGSVGPPEVAAVLARMTQEGKLSTRVEGKTLHMKLLVARHTLKGYELDLVDAFFENGQNETDTDAVKRRYKAAGFNPAALIQDEIEAQIPGNDGKEKVKRFRAPTDVFFILGSLALLAASAFFGESDKVLAVVGFFITMFFSIFAAALAAYMSRAITNLTSAFLGPALLLAIASGPLFVAALIARNADFHAPILFALALWTLAWMKLVLDLLRIRDTPDRIAFRKRIAGTREFFIQQLWVPSPALRDEWFPYVLAFGLGTNVDSWFRSYGGASTSHMASSGSSWSSSSSSSSSSPSWTGGGGSYGGAGATGSWAVAAGAMAAGVSAPSSSSSGGGGGGGSSSGGGGGGGW